MTPNAPKSPLNSGNGDTFSAQVPFVKSITSDTSHQVLNEATSELPKKQVTLLVDDELLLLEALGDFLEIKRPGKVLMASSIDEAFAIFLKERDTIGLLVTDLRILNTSGVELIKNIRDIEPSIPCVLMSGDEQMAREAIGDIKNIVIQRKPFSGKNLNELVEGILK